MGYQTDLLEALRDWGLTVVEVNGWQTRGSSSFNPGGAVNHHTAGSRNGVIPSLRLLTEGRSDLPGPLCNVGQSRSSDFDASQKYDVVYLIAAGRANHAGRGGWQGLVGNSSVFGLEIEHSGSAAEPFSERRQHTAFRIHSAFAEVGGYDISKVCQHKEWAPGRKIDFINADGQDFRNAVALTVLGGKGEPGAPAPAPAPQPAPAPRPEPAPTAGPRVLREGMRGTDVAGWQKLVGVKTDGVFGPATKAATIKFQTAAGLSADGIVGPQTYKAMGQLLAYLSATQKRPLLKRGAKGEQVIHLQRRLRAHGIAVQVDGDFGPKTEAGVKAFQKKRGLQVDGVVGAKTWGMLG
jgi:peptidoglycan hydrolase-like protein with peptidoglycan-binding domain